MKLQPFVEGIKTYPVNLCSEVRKDCSRVVDIVNTDKQVIGIGITLEVPSLQEFKSGGTVTESSVQYQVWVQPFGGDYVLMVDDTISGKSSTYLNILSGGLVAFIATSLIASLNIW